jgi:hypothetical protein
MSNNINNGINSVIMDQTLFILENYVDMMTITNNTQAQITRQQQAMVRKMNVLISELRRQQTIETASEIGNNNTTSNNSRDRSPRERVRSRFEQETRNNGAGRRQVRARPPASNSRGRSRTSNSVHTPPVHRQPLFNFSNTLNTDTNTGNTNGSNNASTTTPFTPRPSSSGILLNLEHFLPFGSGQNFTTNRSTFQPSFGRGLFENVPVFPSPEQIETATTSMRFQDISDPINATCPITMESFSPEQIIVKINHCGHIFNQTHIHGWFRSNVRCPVCRYDIREYETENSSSTEENTNTTNNASNSINFTPLSSIRETRENEENSGRRTANSPPAAGGGEYTQETNDDLDSITRLLLQTLLTPTSTENNTQQTPSSQSSISTTTIPVTWSHIIPSVPISPLTFTQQTTFSPSTGSRNNETFPSPHDTHETNYVFTHSIVDPNTQEETDGSADEFLSQD